jgi:PAS domain S-box-containing protein
MTAEHAGERSFAAPNEADRSASGSQPRHLGPTNGNSVTENEERYRALVQASTAIVWRADKEGSVLEVWRWTELCGQSSEECAGDGWLKALHPEDRDTAALAWQEAVSTGRPYLTEYRIRRTEGEYRWIHARGVPLRNDDGSIREWIGTLTDIHQRREAEAALNEANRTLSDLMAGLQRQNIRFEAALDNMVQGLCMIDPQQRLVVSNRRFMEMFRLSPKVVRPGAGFREILEHSFAAGNYTDEEAGRLLNEWTDHAPANEEKVSRQHLKDGRIIAVLQTSMPDGGSLLTYQDVTAQANAEQELRAHAAKLEHSNRELQEFAFVASHDLQEPLRKIEAFGDRLQTKFGDVLNDDGKLYLERMQSAAKRMRTLIDDLLSYSRVTSKAKPFDRVSLANVAREVVSDLEIRIAETGAVVQVGPLFEIAADGTQMRQLFQNLLSNALKFRNPDRPPEVVISSRILPSDGRQRTKQCEITVADNGIGFDEKYLDRIFSIFQRLHGKTQYEGNGIGLATVRKIIDRHGGTITAKSRPGEGATFIITLPVRQTVSENAS